MYNNKRFRNIKNVFPSNTGLNMNILLFEYKNKKNMMDTVRAPQLKIKLYCIYKNEKKINI